MAAKTEIKNLAVICDHCAGPIPVSMVDEPEIVCTRCGHHLKRYETSSAATTVAFSLTALIFYVPAMMFPFMTVELNGNRTNSTIWNGVVQLADHGSWFVAGIVLLASIVIPVVKLLILFYLSLTAHHNRHPRFKTGLFRFVESIGRWSMLDIFLLAVMVAVMKLNPWTFVEPEIGSLMFTLVVLFTMFASASFDPQLLWKDD